ncbi:hypothetical protein FHX74_002883 [Friedmanniella endophytica]|uniref:Sulfotransferase family protein n=2 Tax=Microlunatus kandeliicorticis TaxID=1759536 RepID=A0A7W3P6T2_9ACTN|nr:hypothetical protein [Microlunatus kandeliicorticis]
MSLKAALERLLGGRCYHMVEFFAHPEHAPTWAAAFRGELPDWESLLTGYVAGVDTPICEFWRPLAEAYPDAPVLLSHRADEDVWFASLEKTVLAQARAAREQGMPGWAAALPADQRDAAVEVFGRLGGTVFGSLDDPAVIKDAYRRRLEEVRAAVPADRLVEWQPGDGWEPLCAALGVAVPAEPFPHENTTADFVARVERGRSPG